MIIATRIIGVILLLFWLFYIPVARRYMRTVGSVIGRKLSIDFVDFVNFVI